jgi:glycosidase
MSWAPDAATGGFTRGRPFLPVAPNVASHNAWTAQRDANSLRAFYQAMLRLRHEHASISQGRWLGGHADGLVAQWQRQADGERTLVVLNYGTAGAPVQVRALPAGARLQPLWPAWSAPAQADGQGVAALYLGPQSLRVYTVLRR